MADPLKLSRVANPQELLYTLLAVSHAPQPELLLSGAPPPRRTVGGPASWLVTGPQHAACSSVPHAALPAAACTACTEL